MIQGSEPASRAVTLSERVAGEVKYCVLDLETTGFTRYDRVIEIAVQRIDLRGNILAEYETLVNPDRTTENSEIHGITDRDLRGAPRFSDILGDLGSILDGSVWVAHNAPFDFRFLTNEFRRLDLALPNWPMLCTMRLSGASGGPTQPTLAACCDFYGVQVDGEAHCAMVDVRATSGIFQRIVGPMREQRFAEIYGTESPVWSETMPALGIDEEPCGRTHQRGAAEADQTVTSTIATGAGADREGLKLYVERLKTAMEDRLIEADEYGELLAIANDANLSPSQAQEAHIGYFQSCASKALADGRIDASEERDLTRVAEILGLGQGQLPELIATAPAPARVSADSLEGMTVCFTGAVDATRAGRTVTREELTDAAVSVGMIPKSGVSKKLDVLVAADPHSLSGKARRARDQGIRIVTAAAFLTMIGFATD